MKYIKRYSEKEFPPANTEEKLLMQKLRYALNKFWKPEGCGVSKNRTEDFKKYKFTIYTPSYIRIDSVPNYELKSKYFVNLMLEVGAQKKYEGDNSHFNVTKEQIIELISKIKYLDVSIDAEKYNI